MAPTRGVGLIKTTDTRLWPYAAVLLLAFDLEKLLYVKFSIPPESDLLSTKFLHQTHVGALVLSQLTKTPILPSIRGHVESFVVDFSFISVSFGGKLPTISLTGPLDQQYTDVAIMTRTHSACIPLHI